MQSKPDAPSRFEWNHPRDIEWPSHKQAWTTVAILTLIQGINAIDRNLVFDGLVDLEIDRVRQVSPHGLSRVGAGHSQLLG